MEELFELRTFIEREDYIGALNLIGEMEEMSRDDKINKIESYLEVLLLHLIKRHAERRSTRSWEVSIRNSVRGIMRANKRRKAGGRYLEEEELREALYEIYPAALDRASVEALEGRYDGKELAQKFDAEEIGNEALELIRKAEHGSIE